MNKDYRTFFARVTGAEAPHPWQAELGEDPSCRERTIRIPTGFGKTAGVVLPWLYHRVERADGTWPRRLVFCLPMRVLVEQTERAIRGWVERAGLAERARVHVLMGGVVADRWVLDVDTPAILVGTQDMLLSRALNRGYAAARGLWPMEYGLLHQDALWVFDEVQLMDVGLATSVQLAAFRAEDAAKGSTPLRPTHTWWMSATLQTNWLATVDRPAPIEAPLAIPAALREGGLFAVRKPLERAREVQGPDAIAKEALARHLPASLTLVIVNRVATANAVFDALEAAVSGGKGKKTKREAQPATATGPELRLVHSRFRGHERARWAEEFLRRDAAMPSAGRIVVATQVVEAGVDLSARTLLTELAPWPSLVQRFGRVARYVGDQGTAIVVGATPPDDKGSAPYSQVELLAADEGITGLLSREADASPRCLEAFEDELGSRDASLLARLFPYAPLHVLRRRDLDDLFDTSADLSGADLDVSRFIRSGDERDVTVFWRPLEGVTGQSASSPRRAGLRLEEPPRREELCPVAIGEIRAWKGKTYVFDYLDGVWAERDPKRIVPGMTVLLDADAGGYSPERGWDPKAKRVEAVPLSASLGGAPARALSAASSAQEGEELSRAEWKTIATHGLEAEREARALCAAIGIPPSLVHVVALAARWHDVGKGHQIFQDAILTGSRASARGGARRDLAKAPESAWARPPYPERPGFRHELASVLALFEVLRRASPFHSALLGPHRALLEALGTAAELPSEAEAIATSPVVAEIVALSAADFDLLAWLVCAHHGKVRTLWTSTPHDQQRRHGGIHGVCDGDVLPSLELADAAGERLALPSLELSLAAAVMGMGARYGASWGERVRGLVGRHGPFALAYLEALVRVADVRASRLDTEDAFA